METLQKLYWIAIIALVILCPIGYVLWRRTIRQLAYNDGMRPAETERPAEQAIIKQEFQAQQPMAGAGVRKTIKLAPLEEVVRQLIQKAPHIGIIGKTGDGKTTTGEAIIRLLHGEAFVIDPKWWKGKWGGLAAAGIDDDAGYGQIASNLGSVFQEFNRRRIHKRDNPEAMFTDLWLIWDEINDTMEEVPNAGVPLRRLLRVGREYNVHVLLFPQSDRVGALGLDGHGDAVQNVVWVYLGSDARKVVNRLVDDKKLDAATAQYILALPRPCVVAHGGQHYAVDLSSAQRLAAGPLTMLGSWKVPGPRSEDEKNQNSALGPADLPAENKSAKWPELREAAIQLWISQGLSDTAIAVKVDMRKEDARALVKSVRAKMDLEAQQKVLQELIVKPAAQPVT